MRLFEADETSLLLKIEQAEELTAALQEAAAEARSLPQSVYPGVPSPDGRGLSVGPPAADRAADVAAHRLKHHLNRHPVADWMHQQVYLQPYAKEWAVLFS
jgi:hypothetical protein